MVHAKDVLANQLLANANDPSWYSPFAQAVEGLAEEEAFWKLDGNSNSIAEITQHLLYWNNAWQTRYHLGRVDAVPPIEDNNSSFVIPEGTAFDQLRTKLLEVLLGWQPLLQEDRLEAKVAGFPVPAEWWEIISNAAMHNAYHIGQIVFVRKLIGSRE
ncbi:DltD domain-containing protein [Paenibacillus sp. FSL H7-0357]|uniref:DinB family protein n=1 Tax=Paenibacillus sp. FSL H7-0357 TaxID=1536774 RepID=UPI0004F745D8|nr:DinB family protein [Paenibacillus sp. FSL H7-0357]AIQ15746.1 DltD domain-containing protein [Paenibacillus sp. FSL H7-0357]